MTRLSLVPLGSLADFINGDRSKNYPSGTDFVETGIPFLSAADINGGRLNQEFTKRITREAFNRLSSGKTQVDDILFCLRGSLGKMARIERVEEAAIASSLVIVRAKPHIDPRFLYYLLQSPFIQGITNALDNGSVQPNLSVREVSNIEVPMFPFNAQRAIAAVLGALDDKIEQNRQMNGTLEATARALFRSWFVDFDPVRAKMDGRPTGLPAELSALFPGGMEADGVERPLGWGVGRIGDIAENVRRGVQPDNIAPGTPYIALEHMPRGSISLSEWGIADTLESNKSGFKRGEILFGKLRPYFHKVGVAPVDGVCSTDILVIRPQNPVWFGIALGHISSRELIDHTTALSTGTKMPRTNWNDIAQYEITLPPVELAIKYSDLMLQFVQRIQSSIEESRTLAALRDGLLPKLMSGEVRVGESIRSTIDPLQENIS